MEDCGKASPHLQAASIPPAETLGPRWFPLQAPRGPRALSLLTVGGPAFFCLFLHCSCHFTLGNQTQHFLLGDGSNLYRFLRNKYVLFHASKALLHAQLAEPHVQLLHWCQWRVAHSPQPQPFLNSASGSWWNSQCPDDCRDPNVTIPAGLGPSCGKAACHLHTSSTHKKVWHTLAPDAPPGLLANAEYAFWDRASPRASTSGKESHHCLSSG